MTQTSTSTTGRADDERTGTHAGKRVLITGGSRGLGLAMAEGFAREGATLVISSRSEESCRESADALTEDTGATVVPIPCHVGRWDQIDTLVERTYDAIGGVDILINNAGMAPLFDSLSGVSEELFDKTVAVNLKGPFRLSALIGERMRTEGGGSIVNISSVAAIKPKPTDLIYAAAKAGLDALTLGMARTLAPEVRVNTIMAGPFLTDVAKHWDMSVVGPRIESYPMGRAGEPEEIVAAALYLTSDGASFTTGAILRVDGGMGIV